MCLQKRLSDNKLSFVSNHEIWCCLGTSRLLWCENTGGGAAHFPSFPFNYRLIGLAVLQFRNPIRRIFL